MTEVARKGTDEKFCSECGSVIKAKAEICPKCGVRQFVPPNSPSAVAPKGKSRLAAALFALFLGGLGAHKFYLGRIGWGVIYVLLSWTFIPAILGFIEAILLFLMSEADFSAKYGAV